MFRLQPMPIEPRDILSSNVAIEPSYSKWFSAVNYKVGDRAYSEDTQIVYQSINDHSNSNPDEDDGANWVKYQATNFWRAFDDEFSTETENIGSIEYMIRPRGRVTAIAFDGLQCHLLRVRVLNTNNSVAFDSGEIEMLDFGAVLPANIYEYCMASPTSQTQRIIHGFDALGPQRIEVSILGRGGLAKVSRILLAVKPEPLGNSRPGTAIGVENLSEVAFDQFGQLSGTDREKLRAVRFVWQVPVGQEDAITRLLSPRLSIPTLYTTNLDDQSRGTMIFGIGTIDAIPLPVKGVTEFSMEVTGAS